MNALPVIAVFDIGKTNKKLFLFDEHYKIVHEQTDRFPETADEDGFPCENLDLLTGWVKDHFRKQLKNKEFSVEALNFSSYGASFVHIDGSGKAFLPLYNYLKPYPAALKKRFFDTYGGEKLVSRVTASPVLDSLNSGLQIYRLKYEKNLLGTGGYSLHLPQYLSYLVTGKPCSDITSIGCHTMLWDFSRSAYHAWVSAEGVSKRLAPIFPGNETVDIGFNGRTVHVGGGLHDSSSALIPYLSGFHQPFVLISTGTWCISMNPFNDIPLSDRELEQDCLCFITYEGRPVKASRLFAGNEHEEQARRLAAHFNKTFNYFETVAYDPSIVSRLAKIPGATRIEVDFPGPSAFGRRDVENFGTYEEAYHRLIMDIMDQQVRSTSLVMEGTTVKRMFVDGGFSRNAVFMNLLARSFPSLEVFAASVAQATAIGAALSIHQQWNAQQLPSDLIKLRYYSA